MITVFHNDKAIKYFLSKNFAEATIQPVALVDTDYLEDAYKYTQNFWAKNPNVKSLKDTSCRSTMVGDILKKDNKYYVVEFAGFRDLTKDEIKEIKDLKGTFDPI